MEIHSCGSFVSLCLFRWGDDDDGSNRFLLPKFLINLSSSALISLENLVLPVLVRTISAVLLR